MSLLDEYNPLNAIEVSGGTIANPKGLILVVGPNSAGKSLFLRDINRYLSQGNRRSVVCTNLVGTRPRDCDQFVKDLLHRNYLRLVPEGTKDQYRTFVPFLAGTQNREVITTRSLMDAYDSFSNQEADKASTIDWFRRIGITLVANIGLENRRQLCEKIKTFNFALETPDHPLQALSLNSDAQERLADETSSVFGNAAWLDISNKDFLQIRVSGERTRPPIGKMNNPMEAVSYRAVEEEGDGYRSYVGICLALLTGRRPVALIDEPELCLHPPQAYHIGRFIGANAHPDHATFVATHSSFVMRGVLETAKAVTIIRLTNTRSQFRGDLISDTLLRSVIRNPRTRAESIFDGIFSKGVALVESEGDREVYQAAAEGMEDYPSREIHFASVGGLGGFSGPLRFYRSLRIPVAVIADLDLINDTARVEATLNDACRHRDECETLLTLQRDVIQRIRSLPPTFTPSDAVSRLEQLSRRSWNWQGGDDNVLRRELNELERELRRMNRLKRGGVDAYLEVPEIHSRLANIIDELSKKGIFLVPVGELEDWIRPLMAEEASDAISKLDRATIAAEKIRAAETKSGDVWGFVKKVADYLKAVGQNV